MTVGLVYSPQYTMDFWDHVFPVEKYRLTYEKLRAEGVTGFVEPEPATDEQLLLVHSRKYVDLVNTLTDDPQLGIAMFEIPCTREVVEKFRLAAGGTILAAQLAMEKGAGANLSGGFHHAFPDHGEGFCIFNDLAVAIRVLQREGRIRKAAVIDCDLHQGNGTAAAFRDDPSVYTFSIHQENLYPVPKQKSTWDIGLDDFAGDAQFNGALANAVPKILDAFKPDLVVFQAGADPYKGDRLGALRLTIEGLRARDEIVIGESRRRKIPLVLTLGGGYAEEIDDVVEIHANSVRVLLSHSSV